MKILSLEASAKVASVAISQDNLLICEFTTNNGLTHSQTLMPLIDKALKSAHFELSEIELIAVSNGPGSFTGLRIGVATVKGLAHGANIPVVGVSTLKAMAYNIPFCDGIICPIMDARRGEVYNALYKWDKNTLVEIKEPRALPLDMLLEELLQSKETATFLGDGVEVHKEAIIKKLGDNARFAPVGLNLQKASGLIVEAMKSFEKNEVSDSFDLAPFYLRKSQAEREAEERENNNVKEG